GFLEPPLRQQRVTILEAAMQIAGQRLGHAALRDALHRERFERAAYVDGVGDLRAGERAHQVAARLVLDQQAFLRQQGQGLAHRRARHAEQIGERRLGDALTGRELAVQDHLPESNYRLGHLRAHACRIIDCGIPLVSTGSHRAFDYPRNGCAQNRDTQTELVGPPVVAGHAPLLRRASRRSRSRAYRSETNRFASMARALGAFSTGKDASSASMRSRTGCSNSWW